MKTMILSDFIAIRHSIIQTFAIAAFIGAVCAIAFGNVIVMTACICAAVPIGFLFGLAAIDDRKDWSGYRLSMPLSRRDVVTGRYAFLALVMVAAGLASIVLSWVFSLIVSGLMPSLGIGVALTNDTVPLFAGDSVDLLFALMTAFTFVLFALAITLPLVMRFGLTRAIRFVPVAFCIVFLIVFFAAGDSAILESVAHAIEHSLALQIAVPVAGFAVAACCFAASAALSVRLYAHREF